MYMLMLIENYYFVGRGVTCNLEMCFGRHFKWFVELTVAKE